MLDNPNILFCTVDSLRKDRVDDETMPYLAQLANDGITFERMYSTAPATAASFVSLMASRYYSDVDGIGLPDREFTTIAEALPVEYATIGESTNKFTSSYYNYDRGFDAFKSPTSGLKFAIRRHLDEDSRLFRMLEWGYHHWLQINAGRGENQRSWWSQPAEDVNHRLTQQMDTDDPWFVWAHHMEPHHPLEPPTDYLPDSVENRGEAQSLSRELPGLIQPDQTAEMSTIGALYDAECRYWDDEFRKLHDSVSDDTLVVVVGDHGELLNDHNRYGHPHEMWQELTNVPCVIYHPELPSATIDSLQSTIDLAPTMLSLLDESPPLSMRGSSIDIDQPAPRDEVFGTIETPDNVGMVRTDDWVWMRHKSRRSTQDDHGELLFPANEGDPAVAVGKQIAGKHPDVRDRLARDFSTTVEAADTATGHTMDDEQVKQHMADLGYLEQT